MTKFYAFILLIACFFNQVSQAQTVKHSVFLIGDDGEPKLDGKDPVLTSLQNQLKKAGQNGSLIFLGDNIYPTGMVDSENPGRIEAEARLTEQLKVMQSFEGHSYIIPGNHDWQQGGKNGWQYIKNQENFVSDFLKKEDVFFPKGGCPTPQEISVNEELSLILLDTQWYLHPWNKPEAESDCEVKSLQGMLSAVDDILDRNRHKKVLVLGHHPMYSHGLHGGYFTVKDHLLPFHELGLNIPLPVIGSIYPLYRSLIGNIQDIAHPKYREMRDGLVSIFKHYKNVIYANGHDHNLQLIVRDSINYITSGAGSKATPVKKGNDSRFASSTKGFVRLDFLENDKIQVIFYEGDGALGKELYSTPISLVTRPFEATNSVSARQNIPSQIIPNPKFKAGSVKQWILGKNYRDVWTTPVSAPVLNFQQEKGGLKVIQKGGGLQTLSLRYQAASGGQYVTRSINKYPEEAVPESIRSQFTVDIVGDQISAAHPFAALVVPDLAEAAGVPHTNPKLVVIPEDTALGPYKRLFSNQLALFEERPDDGFGGAKKTYSTIKVVGKLADDNHNVVDQKAVLRARLLDMLIGDWDRHDDQWRWGSFDQKGKGSVFRPIPRDRDQAFFINEGALPAIAARKWILPKIQGFNHKIRDVEGFNFNARYFDRSFLTKLSQNDWQEITRDFQFKITDAIIDSAVSRLPKPDPHAKEIAEKLKQRRDDMLQYAEKQYEFLAKEVDILGSDKDEIIEVKRMPDGQTEVTVLDQNKSGEAGRELYKRTFNPLFTKEIRVWGFDGEDRFRVYGEADKAIKLRLIGGKGADEFTDSSRIGGFRRKTLIYDKTKNTVLNLGSEARNLTSDKDPKINDYNREAFKYNRLAPLAAFAYNPDDGIFLGTGIQLTRQGFRKEPFASQHNLSGSFAFSTRAFNLYYAGTFVDVLGKTDLEIKATLQQSSMTNNFFGLSNESNYIKEKQIDYYRVNYSNYETSVFLKNNVGKTVFYYGVIQNGFEVKENTSRYINEFAPVGSEVYNEKDYLGVRTGFTVDARDNKVFPTRGVYWDFSSTYQRGINALAKDSYANLRTDLAFYWSVKLPATVTFATRFGGGVNFTDFEFYQANSLGGLTNLRGFRRTRFSGKNSAYNNTEVRLKLFDIKSYLFPAHFGIVAFNDIGRVWNPGENSTKWHHGYGGGVWLAPFNMAVISAMYSMSEEDKVPIIRMGFFF
ncbi:Calcineurin-like phosphoesterase [Pseudarcicella hirudinis]|uniref:Calcineurin-like phosphoesterase n=1 Tax=Pseudarcicella hirudinis TaxID=1079859 RepID=A0A1I5XFG7_9BACT|nr:BamA/TamA family outer membrane protein [Pseudarcicella hirudinis]SFQ30700.1 Calcineurin-like phosphoesterase [Pseudarcicella hirudinis]